jgi:hypothetical protein
VGSSLLLRSSRSAAAQSRYTSHSITASTPLKYRTAARPFVPGLACRYVPTSNQIRLGAGSCLLHRFAALW